MLNIPADEAWCDGDTPERAQLHLHGRATAIHINAALTRAQAVILMVSIQDWLKATQDRSREHFVAEITRIAAPGIRLDE